MKWVLGVLFALILISSVYALPVNDVSLNNYLNDYTSTVSADNANKINSIAKSLQSKGVEYAIVIVDNTDGIPISDYALEVGHENIGGEDDKGLVTIIALEQREYYTAVGYGLEGDLNDAKIGRFQRTYLVPAFQENKYGEGLINLAAAIHVELFPDSEVPENIVPPPVPEQGFRWNNIGFVGFLVIYFLIRGLIGMFSKDPKKRRNAEDSFTAALIASMFMRGGRGGMGGSGGFGGFSGGGFGGGGAGGNF